MAAIDYEYQVIHVPSGQNLTKRYRNMGNALNRLEESHLVPDDADAAEKYLRDCVVRKYKTVPDRDLGMDDVYEFVPGQVVYERVYEQHPCTTCNGEPPKGFECQTCHNSGEMEVAVAKKVHMSTWYRAHGTGYKGPRKRASGPFFYTPEEASE